MPPRGRKPKPTHLKVVTGNPGKRQLNEHEPKPDLAIPAPPPHLSDEAKVEWGRVCDQLYRLKLLSEIDRASLAAYCQAYGRWVQAERALAKMAENDGVTKGLLVKTRNGNAIQNPLVGTANKAPAWSIASTCAPDAPSGDLPICQKKLDATRRLPPTGLEQT